VEDVADVSLDWCMDDDISYKQKHKSYENIVVPAIASPHQLSAVVQAKRTSVMKKLMHVYNNIS